MNVDILNQLLTNLGGTAMLGGLAVFFVKRWLDKVDGSLRSLANEISDLKTKQAISQERESNVRGQIESLASSIKETDKSVGKLASSVSKAWLVLQNSNLTATRLSDQK
jgi:septal ring factor EnvC (AmiA/AmiB activator)